MGQTDPMGKCGATTRRGTPCERDAGWGTPTPGIGRCRYHGGLSPNAMIASGAVAARREALLLGEAEDVHPIDAILGALKLAWCEVRYYTLRIADLEADEIVGPVITTRLEPVALDDDARELFGLPPDAGDTVVTEVREGPPQLHIWMKARHQAMDRAVRYGEIALRAGIAERQIRLAEQAGGQLAPVIGAILRELGVFDDERAPEIVRRHLTLIEGTATVLPNAA